MARPEGLEPPTYGFEARRSIQLSYGRATHKIYHTPPRTARTPAPTASDALKIDRSGTTLASR